MKLDGNKNRFIVAGPFDEEMPYYYVVINNLSFWLENEAEILAWLYENLSSPSAYSHQGMIVSFKQESDLTAFLLKWG